MSEIINDTSGFEAEAPGPAPAGWQDNGARKRRGFLDLNPQDVEPIRNDPALMGRTPEEEAAAERGLTAMSNKIVKARAADGQGNPLGWASSSITPGALHTKQKGDQYVGEDHELGWRGGEGSKQSDMVTTKYATPQEQEQNRVRLEGPEGQKALTNAAGKPVSGHLGFVADGAGALHTFDEETDDRVVLPDGSKVPNTQVPDANGGFMPKAQPHNPDTAAPFMTGALKYEAVHHTTPLAGAPVAGAGFVDVCGGALDQMNDQSGHYAPEAEYLHQTVASLDQQGAKMQRHKEVGGHEGPKSMDVTLSGGGAIGGRPVGKGWIGEHNATPGNAKIPEGPLTLPYQAFLQTHGNEAQMRLKQAANQELKGKVREAPPTREESEAERIACEDAQSELARSKYTDTYKPFPAAS